MRRDTFLSVILAALMATGMITAPVTALVSDTPEPTVVRAGGQPTFVVELANESGADDSLRSWENLSQNRQVVSIDNASNTATVSAPRWQISASFWSQLTAVSAEPTDVRDIFGTTQLAERSYINATHPNYRLRYVEPIQSLGSEDEVEVETIGVTSVNDPSHPMEGVAFEEDTSETTLAEVRSITGVGNVSADTSNLTIAVADTGINTADGKTFGNGTAGSQLRISNASKNVLTGETVNESGYGVLEDGNGHGTWTAAAAAANVSGTTHDGMAPNANLLILKTLADDGGGGTSDIAEGIRYAADQNADVISLSLGSKVYSQPIADAVDYATDQGAVVVVAAGNSRFSRSPGIATPADVPQDGVVTVGASNGSAAASAWSASFSQVGPDPSTTDGETLQSKGAGVDVVAPGMAVTARVPRTDGTLTNSTLSGTSMSTPEVSGGILYAMATNSTLASADPATVEDAVAASARPAKHMAAVEAGNGMVAIDNLADGTTPEQSQTDVMTDPAQQREDYYQAAFESAGGWIPKSVSRVGS